MYSSTADVIKDLEKKGQLIRVSEEVDPDLEMAEIHRRIYNAGGPAVLFENIKGCSFTAVSNLFGTVERARYIFRKSIKPVKALVAMKADMPSALKNPLNLLQAGRAALHALPSRSLMRKPVFYRQISLHELPQIKSWPDDGGAFVTLPQVLTENYNRPGILQSNIGMYRIQLSGNDYVPGKEAGMHYQIHRGIGAHHAVAIRQGRKLKVTIAIGGPPAHSFAAVMPLPENLPEAMFAGALASRRFRYTRYKGYLVPVDADFVILGEVAGDLKPEGPFGDHLGYYSLAHDFPYMNVEAVFHRKNAIWPFTVVGRPPQEDTVFGHMIHELTSPMVPASITGLQAMHAVDESGVHPLLLAVGSERYVPYSERQPREILTIANAVLGFNQASLAKYLFIAAGEDNPPAIHDVEAFLQHILERFDFSRDLHFQTATTIDTLDYSGTALNEGSKVVFAAAGEKKRELAGQLPKTGTLPKGFSDLKMVTAGIIAVKGPRFKNYRSAEKEMKSLEDYLFRKKTAFKGIPLLIVCDDPGFCAEVFKNFIWVTFTRSNPSHDIYGAGSFIEYKHWVARGSIIIDARIKPHHAPPLIEDEKVSERVDRLFAEGGSLHRQV